METSFGLFSEGACGTRIEAQSWPHLEAGSWLYFQSVIYCGLSEGRVESPWEGNSQEWEAALSPQQPQSSGKTGMQDW